MLVALSALLSLSLSLARPHAVRPPRCARLLLLAELACSASLCSLAPRRLCILCSVLLLLKQRALPRRAPVRCRLGRHALVRVHLCVLSGVSLFSSAPTLSCSRSLCVRSDALGRVLTESPAFSARLLTRSTLLALRAHTEAATPRSLLKSMPPTVRPRRRTFHVAHRDRR